MPLYWEPLAWSLIGGVATWNRDLGPSLVFHCHCGYTAALRMDRSNAFFCGGTNCRHGSSRFPITQASEARIIRAAASRDDLVNLTSHRVSFPWLATEAHN